MNKMIKNMMLVLALGFVTQAQPMFMGNGGAKNVSAQFYLNDKIFVDKDIICIVGLDKVAIFNKSNEVSFEITNVALVNEIRCFCFKNQKTSEDIQEDLKMASKEPFIRVDGLVLKVRQIELEGSLALEKQKKASIKNKKIFFLRPTRATKSLLYPQKTKIM